MPTKPEADPGTPVGEGAEVGNTEPNPIAELTDDVGEIMELARTQNELIQAQADELAELKKTVEKLTPKNPNRPRKPVIPAPPPEGSKRYRSMGAEPLYVKDGGGTIVIDGQVVRRPLVGANFSGHVYQTDDPEIIAWLDQHAENGKSFWEDPTAIPRHTIVGVTEGVRSTSDTPRNPLAAPMQR